MKWKVRAKNPINSKELTYEIIISKGLGKLTKRAETLLLLLVEHVIRRQDYYNNDDKFDCLQTSYYNIFTKWKSFNPDKTINAFAYYTEVHKRSTVEMLNTLYNKKGLSDSEQHSIKTISINTSNNGGGLYNI